MQRHAHAKRSDALRPRLSRERSLGIERGGHRIRCRGEGGLHRIADDLEEHAAMRLNGRSQEGEVALDRGGHRRPGPAPTARCCPRCR